MMSDTALSVLDLVPVRTGQTSAEAIAASLALTETAERLGYRRYWFAEHHNMPSVASTTPPVLIAAAATRTSRLRLGSGGVMLPNHAPLIVAEQFAALEAIAPGRIDLGLGRAPGSDPVITQLLRGSGTTSDVEQFPRHVQRHRRTALGRRRHRALHLRGEYTVRATPAATGTPEVWLLGSSDYSAQLAASHGLPYVLREPLLGAGSRARAGSLPHRLPPRARSTREPRTFLTVNAVAAPTQEEAEARALPQLRMMARLRLNQPLAALETVEQAAAAVTDAATDEVVQAARSRVVRRHGRKRRGRGARLRRPLRRRRGHALSCRGCLRRRAERCPDRPRADAGAHRRRPAPLMSSACQPLAFPAAQA